jgi:hypothetical protein
MMKIIKSQDVKWLFWGLIPLIVMSSVFLIHQTRSQVVDDWVPFTAFYTETSQNVTTLKTLQIPQLYAAVRSDGSRSSGSLDLRLGYRKIKDRRENKDITISDFLKLKSTLDYSYIPISTPRRLITSDCRTAAGVGAQLIGYDTIAGYDAFHYQLSTVLSDKTKRELNQWLVPDLGCWEIRQLSRKLNTEGVLQGIFEKTITKVIPGDPDISLFNIPADYKEVKSSDLERALHQQKVTDRDGVYGALKDETPICILERWRQANDHYDAVANKSWQPIAKR